MKIALLTTDNRWVHQEFDKETPWFGMAPEALLSGLAALPDVEVHVVSCTRQPLKSPAKLAGNVWFHSLHVPKIGWMRTGYLGCIRAVRKRLKLIQPDIVHGHGTELESAICAAFSGFPNVITLLGIMKEMVRILSARPGSFFWFASLLESRALRRTAGVLANSRFTEAKVRGRTPRTWLVPNAVREAFFETPLKPSLSPSGEARLSEGPGREFPESFSRLVPRNPPPAPPRRGATPGGQFPSWEGSGVGRPEPGSWRGSQRAPILLNVGTVCAYKRQNELLDVAGQLQAEGLDFQLQFLGQASPDDPYAARFLARIQNNSRVSHHGFKSLSEIIESYDSASALVHVSAVESFGLVVAEALSRNLKFIGFSSGGVADIVAGVQGAEAFPDGDWTNVRSAMSRWIRAGSVLPNTAAEMMRQRYHPVRIARQHLEVYHEVLGRTG